MPAVAQTHLEWSSFGTLGITVSDSERYGYRKDISVDEGVYSGDIDWKNNSLLGIQFEASIADNFDFVSQAVLRDMADPSLDKYFTLAFIRYTPSANWTIRVGRTSPDIFLITEYRDINIAYSWASVPNEIYGLIPYRHIDGADITYTTRIAGSTFSSKFFTGVSEADITYTDTPELVKVEDVYGVSLTLDHTDWILQAKYTQTKFPNETESNQYIIDQIKSLPDYIWPNPEQFIEDMSVKGKKITYSSINGQAYLNNFIFTSEFAQISSDTITLSKLRNAYVSAAYQHNKYTFYSILAQTNSDNFHFNQTNVNQALIPELVYGIEGALNYYSSNQHTFSLGMRWDLNAKVAAYLQWNNTLIDEQGDTLWLNNSNQSPSERVNTYMFNVSFAL